MPGMLILLPPSEGKAPAPAKGPAWESIAEDPKKNAFGELNPQRRQVMEALWAMLTTGQGLEKLFGVKGKALEAAVRENDTLLEAACQPAEALYTGVLYDALAPGTLPRKAHQAFVRSTIILSGLWGAVRPSDLLPPYKLKMGADPGTGKLSTFWRPALEELVNREARGRIVWDLLPNEHAAAWKERPAEARIFSVRFLDREMRKGKELLKTVSHANKALKGELVRRLLMEPVADWQDLETWEPESGYRLAPERCTVGEGGGELIFLRERPGA